MNGCRLRACENRSFRCRTSRGSPRGQGWRLSQPLDPNQGTLTLIPLSCASSVERQVNVVLRVEIQRIQEAFSLSLSLSLSVFCIQTRNIFSRCGPKRGRGERPPVDAPLRAMSSFPLLCTQIYLPRVSAFHCEAQTALEKCFSLNNSSLNLLCCPLRVWSP